MSNNVNMTDIIKESFVGYAGAVAQNRALVDVRDCLKPSARQIFYALVTGGFTHDKAFKKTLKAIGEVFKYYIHGDSSAEGILMRASQEFAMRYPLVEVEGSNGSLLESASWAAPRYTEARLSEFSERLFDSIKKDTISVWLDNYDNTEQYPSVLPSKGFYNICNGTSGIGTGLASSIPQFNIKDVNKALEKLLLNPDISFEEIYCQPDFATGAYLINEDEVKASLKFGSKRAASKEGEAGAACKLRSKIDYNEKENCLIVTEIPYGVYTNTISNQLAALLELEQKEEIEPTGIEKFNDLTNTEPFIKIYLKKGVNPNVVINLLYKATSLEYWFGINLTMLSNEGHFPKVFTWKEALQEHIDHEKVVYRRGFEFDLNKIEKRIHIINGLLICIASIDEVVKVIKASKSTADAANALREKFLLDEVQAKAVLDIKLSRLAHLEVQKLENEKAGLEAEFKRISAILNDINLFNNELIKGWREVAAKYGDDHRTKVIKVPKLTKQEKEIEAVVPENVVVVITKTGLIKRVPTTSFRTQRKGGKGVKSDDDVILDVIKTNTVDNILLFSNKGKMYRTIADNIPSATNAAKGTYIGNLIKLEKDEKIMAISSLHRKSTPKHIIFVTKQGLIKKSLLEEYTKTNRNTGISALNIKDGDEVVDIIFQDDEDMLFITKNGMSIRFSTKDIGTLGRNAQGVKGIKLAEGDEVVAALPVHKETDQVAVFSSGGLAKKVPVKDFQVQGRGGKGTIVYKPTESSGTVIGAAMVSDEDLVLISGEKKSICISATDIPSLGKTGLGNIMIKGNKIFSVTKI